MKCGCLAGILAKMLAQQAELATILANDHQERNTVRRAQLAEEVRTTQADFATFIAKFQIQVKKRTGTPTPASSGCR